MKTLEIKRVLVPIDFSEVSLNALESAIAICKIQLSTLTLIHIVENNFMLFSQELSGLNGNILSDLMKIAEDQLSKLAKKIRVKHDIVVNHIVQPGNPADETCMFAVQKQSDLIVIATHGTSGFREFFLGSNAYRVVKNAPCPVLTIPGKSSWTEFRNILFPIRMVPNAFEKYDVVRPIIRRNNSSLLIAGFIQLKFPTGFVEMKEKVDHYKNIVLRDDVICRSEVHTCDNVAKKVLSISEIERPDLIVITATLDEKLKDFFIGPYTQTIVNHAHFPVLSIRPEINRDLVSPTPVTSSAEDGFNLYKPNIVAGV
ncbi:MAG: universal stress protein [Saprospiraceae bacterium]